LGRGGTVAGREVLRLALQHQVHRAAGHAGEQRREQRVFAGRPFAAEAAAHVLRDHLDAIERQAEPLRQVGAHVEDALC
jgi:hypothetical protein